jgi:hypothetical protein
MAPSTAAAAGMYRLFLIILIFCKLVLVYYYISTYPRVTCQRVRVRVDPGKNKLTREKTRTRTVGTGTGRPEIPEGYP